LTFEQIRELIDIVCSTGLSSLEIERSDFRIKIESRGGAVLSEHGMPRTGVPLFEPAAGADESAGGTVAEGVHLIVSPIVGTFYAAPSPDSEPYVQVGDTVKAGQVLCIVEAMKLMNEIESDVDGEVVEIFGRNAQPVEYGEQLFAIRSS
jgi:acetyl-CoA carboxylase biotin carboxyl carrier protein